VSGTKPPDKEPGTGRPEEHEGWHDGKIWVEPPPPPKPREIPTFGPDALAPPRIGLRTADGGLSARPVPHAMARRATASGAWLLVLLGAGAGIIAGSYNSWLAMGSPFGSPSASAIVDDGLGEVSLVAGIVLSVVALLIVGTGAGTLLKQLAAAASGAALSAAIYYLVLNFAILPMPSKAYPGWGLILVMVASLAAFVASCAITASTTD